MHEITPHQAIRYSRQISLLDFDLENQEKLLNSRVLIIGIGGLGSAAATYLVSAGVLTITIVDNDVVSLDNLPRQLLYREGDINKSKVSCAKLALEGINPDTTIHSINSLLTVNDLVEAASQHDVVLDCTDNLEARNQINKACFTARVPLVSGAAIQMVGQLFCAIPDAQSACYLCMSRFFNDDQLSCVENGIMSPIVGVIGAMQALEAIKLLTDYGSVGVNQLKLFDGLSGEWSSYKVNSNPMCPICGEHNK